MKAVANSKDHDPASWGLGGLLFGPLALLASLGLPDLKARKYPRLLAEHHAVEAGTGSSLASVKDREDARSPDQVEDADAQRKRILGGNKGDN